MWNVSVTVLFFDTQRREAQMLFNSLFMQHRSEDKQVSKYGDWQVEIIKWINLIFTGMVRDYDAESWNEHTAVAAGKWSPGE